MTASSLPLAALFTLCTLSCQLRADDLRPIPLKSAITQVQPMTGIVLWADNESVTKAPIQLEYSYLNYREIVSPSGEYDWRALDELLTQVASRKHQLILRWYDTYVGKSTGIPESIVKQSGYETTVGKSEGKKTEFPDWSHPALQQFAIDFFSKYAERYDRDPRIAYLQVGFGLWSEYHIYDGPMKLGKTFPSLEYQRKFANHVNTQLQQTPWMISVDAAGDWSPFASDRDLLTLSFGVFDDSFNHAKHAKENEPNWNSLRRDRWKTSPTGGEFSFFEKADQSKALNPRGPHGVSFEEQAKKFHISFMIGDDQMRFQKPDRVRSAGLACGYRFRVTRFESSSSESVIEIENTGIAPIYYDAYPTVNGVRASNSLRGLLPDERKAFKVASGGQVPKLTIACDRLVPGQSIEFDADLQ